MKRQFDLLILAAGFGTRLRPLTDEIPKALLPVGGVPLIDHHIARVIESGLVRNVVVNTHHLAVSLSEHLRRHALRDRIAMSYEPEIMGTGGALANAAEHLRTDPILVLNSDILFRAPLEQLIARHLEGGFLATLALVAEPRWATVLASGERVTEIRRGRPLPGALSFTGCHAVSQEMLQRLPQGVFHDIIDSYLIAIKEQRLGAYVCTAAETCFLDVGTPADYLHAHRICAGEQAHLYGLDHAAMQRARATEGAGLAADLARAASSGWAFVHPLAATAPGAEIVESVVLQHARIGAGAHVLRSIVGPQVEVDSDLADTLITRRGSRPIDSRPIDRAVAG